MRTLVSLILFLGFFIKGFPQQRIVPHLNESMMKDGAINLSFKDAWRFQYGDNTAWASPKYNDATWHNLDPNILEVSHLADSAWQGYGWWRVAFTIDPNLKQQLSHLSFKSWGAAEVYIDGQLVHRYGVFATQPNQSANFVPRYLVDKPIKLAGNDTHVLAVRYAYHHARRDAAILKHNAPSIGFSIGLANVGHSANSENNFTYAIAATASVTALLVLLLCLHLLLIYKFPNDNANRIVAVVIACFLISVFTNYVHLLIQMTPFRFVLFRGFLNSFSFGLGLVLLPYALALIFRLHRFIWTRHLIWIVVVRSVFYFYPVVPIILVDAFFILAVFITIGLIMYKAVKSKLPDIHYVTAGAIGATIFILIDRLFATHVIHLSNGQFYVVFFLVFTCFPVGLSVYITSRYGTLFTSMEKEVANRTSELNHSLQQLQLAQVELTARNAENELLLKEIHHRVKNNLEVVSSLLELQSAQIDDPSVQSAMQASQNRVHSMGIIHQKLYQGQHLAAIEMRDYFINLGESIVHSFNAEGKVNVECDMHQLVLDVDTAISIGLIVNELLTNSLKYAFENKEKGAIKISLKDTSNQDELLLKISDNGIGKPATNNAKGTGFGTQLINLLTRQLDGKLAYEINNGTTVLLHFKKTRLA